MPLNEQQDLQAEKDYTGGPTDGPFEVAVTCAGGATTKGRGCSITDQGDAQTEDWGLAYVRGNGNATAGFHSPGQPRGDCAIAIVHGHGRAWADDRSLVVAGSHWSEHPPVPGHPREAEADEQSIAIVGGGGFANPNYGSIAIAGKGGSVSIKSANSNYPSLLIILDSKRKWRVAVVDPPTDWVVPHLDAGKTYKLDASNKFVEVT
ncbi:MAG: hypothetical protein KKI08_02180 [Armatimonadetes bacterium]|nr:hypothetical protein [Armatimonadota bacterium]